MAAGRKARYTPEQYLDLARADVAHDPTISVKAFRDAHGGGNGDATAVLEAAKWEANVAQYRHLRREDLDPRWRDLARAPLVNAPTDQIDLAAAPEALAQGFDQALNAARDAVTTLIASMRATAQRIVAEEEEKALKDILEAREHEKQIVGNVDVAEREAAEAAAETARVRQELGEQITQLRQELKDQEEAARGAEERREESERSANAKVLAAQELQAKAEEAARKAEDLRLEAQEQLRVSGERLATAERAAGAASQAVEAMKGQIEDLARRANEATEDAKAARAEAAVAKELMGRAEGSLETLKAAHAGQIQSLQAELTALRQQIAAEGK